MRLTLTLLAWLWLLAGCENGLGRAVVDRRSSPEGRDVPPCERLPTCFSNPAVEPREPVPAGLMNTCNATEPIVVGDAAGLAAAGDCVCERRSLVAQGVDQDSAESVQALMLRDCALSLSSTQPYALELGKSQLENVVVSLDGPVSLTVSESDLSRVRFETRANAAGAPSLVLTDSKAFHLSVSDRGAAGAHVRVEHSGLNFAQIVTDRLDLLSSGLLGVRASVQELSALDVLVSACRISAVRALISASAWRSSQLDGCESVLLAQSQLTGTRFGPCTAGMQLYGVESITSQFEGPIEADESGLSSSRFGVTEPTELVSWGGALADSIFCEGAAKAHFKATTLICNDCEGPLEAPDADACLDRSRQEGEPKPAREEELPPNLCPSLIEPRMCPSFPTRRRPHVGD